MTEPKVNGTPVAFAPVADETDPKLMPRDVLVDIVREQRRTVARLREALGQARAQAERATASAHASAAEAVERGREVERLGRRREILAPVAQKLIDAALERVRIITHTDRRDVPEGVLDQAREACEALEAVRVL